MAFRWTAAALALLAANSGVAQDKGTAKEQKKEAPNKEAPQKGGGDVQDVREYVKAQCGGVPGPTTGKLQAPGKGVIAEIKVPEGQVFVGQPGAAQFALATRNDGGDRWAGVLVMDKRSIIVFEFDPIGYMKDADKEQIDADKLMSDMKATDEEANKQRKARGWPAIHIDGWAEKPYYDPQTKNLTWAIKVRNEQGRVSINQEVRLLGREGVMQATLVCGEGEFAQAKKGVNPLLAGYSFTAGNTYAEFKAGDKVAAYGLAGLIAGGAAFGAAKLGLLGWIGAMFAKFAKLGKVAILIVIGALVGVWKLVTGVFLRRRDSSI